MKDGIYNPDDFNAKINDGLHESNKNLKSLEEHENQQAEYYNPSVKIGVGIACPKCSQELYDDSDGMVLASHPPKKRVACKCGYSTTITC